jgi:succinoglycan biosynthesis transport protein ExoP
MERKDVGRVVWRHRLLVVAIMLTTMGAVVLGLYLTPKTYTASATISATASDETASAEDLNALRGTLGELTNSAAVLADVNSQLSEPRTTDQLRRDISGRWVEGTILIQVSVSDSDPDVAAEIANVVTDVLPLYDPSNGAFRFTTTNPAVPAATFSSPNLLLGLGVGALLAIVLAVGGALLRDRHTNRIGDTSEAEEAGDAPVLAHLAPPRDPTTLPALYPGTAAADVFRHLRIALEAEASTHPVHRVVVTGVASGDTNVWLGANLAISLAGVGRRVLLVDGRIGDRHGRPIAAGPDTAGLYDLLNGGELAAALSPGPVDNLSVLPAGDWGGESADTLLETRFASVMARASQRFDVIVVLAPPVDQCADARVMAAGGTILLAVPENGVSPQYLRQHVDRVRADGVRLLGLVLVGKSAERIAV